MVDRKQKKVNERKDEPSRPTEAVAVDGKVVFVGRKPVRNYVIACLTSLSAGTNKVVIKARGRAIPRAVDTYELLRRAFLKDAQIQGISISTEQVSRPGSRTSNVSAIEITIAKP